MYSVIQQPTGVLDGDAGLFLIGWSFCGLILAMTILLFKMLEARREDRLEADHHRRLFGRRDRRIFNVHRNR